MDVRAASLSLAALAALASLAGCEATVTSEPSASSEEALICPIGSHTPPCGQPPTVAECRTVTPACTTQPGTWAQATPQGLNSVTLASDEAWIAALQALGCSTPEAYDPNVTAGVGMFVTTCPVSLSRLPPLPLTLQYWGFTYESMELGCNACFLGFPASGTVRLAWDPSASLPGGCKGGSCSGLGY